MEEELGFLSASLLVKVEGCAWVKGRKHLNCTSFLSRLPNLANVIQSSTLCEISSLLFMAEIKV